MNFTCNGETFGSIHLYWIQRLEKAKTFNFMMQLNRASISGLLFSVSDHSIRMWVIIFTSILLWVINLMDTGILSWIIYGFAFKKMLGLPNSFVSYALISTIHTMNMEYDIGFDYWSGVLELNCMLTQMPALLHGYIILTNLLTCTCI